MIKLSDLILERRDRPKAVIMAGGGGTGKSYLLNQLSLNSLSQFNPDKYVEDKDHPYYNKLGPASNQTAKDAMAATEDKISFVWDTTASGRGFQKNLDTILSRGYDVYMVMVYAHPMISYISNFMARERNIPASAVFSTWRDVYTKIEDYNKKLKGNLAIHVSDRGGKYKKEVEGFDTAAKNGLSGVKDYLQRFNEKNNVGGSSFFQPVEWSSGTASGVFASFLLNERMKGNNISIAGVCSECQADEGLCALQTRVAEYNPLDWSCA